MARTYLSILTVEKRLESKVVRTIHLTDYSVGFHGSNEFDFIRFLSENCLNANHILFVKPTRKYQKAYCQTNLRSIAKIDIVIIAPPLAEEQIGVVQLSDISGYITENDINDPVFRDIVRQLYRNGYYANEQIPEQYWIENPKTRQILPCPKFTGREREVLYWLCHNFDYQEIGRVLNTGASNIRNIISRLRNKTLTRSSIELVATAITCKWVKIDPEKFHGTNPFLRNFPK